MKRIIFLTGIIFLFVSQAALAQRQDEDRQDRWEKFRAEKVAFLTNKLDLTPAEAQKFWPVYNQMEKEKLDAQQTRHDLEKKVRDAAENSSDKEIVKLTRDFAESNSRECSLTTKYNEEFLKILPPQKVLKLYKAEGEFRMYMFKKYRETQRGNDNNGQ